MSFDQPTQWTPPPVEPRRTHAEGVDMDAEVRIIGVELTAIVPNPQTGGIVEEEIEMFSVRHTFPSPTPTAAATTAAVPS